MSYKKFSFANDQELSSQDGFEIWDTPSFNMKSMSDNVEVLLMEVPMK
ncbi:hypothetical protein [Nonlabens xylanidelens]